MIPARTPRPNRRPISAPTARGIRNRSSLVATAERGIAIKTVIMIATRSVASCSKRSPRTTNPKASRTAREAGCRRPDTSTVSLRLALALGCPLVVEPGGAAFALRALLGLGRASFALLGRLRVLLGAFALASCNAMGDLGGAAFALRALLGLGRASFALLGQSRVLLG